MRPTPLPRHGLRALLAATALVGALLAASVAPAAAANPGPIQVPALTGVVTDACSGRPVAGLAVGVTSTVNPGPPQAPALGPAFGLFVYPTKDPGPVQLTVSAPGYVPLGADPATGGAPGVTITINPGPIQFPDGASFAAGLLLDIRLMPTFPPDPCKPPNPNFPAVSGRGIDAATGVGLRGLSVAVAPLVLDPTTGEADPGPTQQPSAGPFLGLFSFKDPGPVNFGFQFYAAAPNHTSLGADATHPPSPNLPLGPGVTVMANPGPVNLPAGSGFVNVSVVIGFALPAGPAGG